MKNIVIAGASGFIGKNLSSYLTPKYNIQNISLRDENWLNHIDNPDVFVNLIGKAHDHKGSSSKRDYFFINVELTKLLFENFKSSDAKIFIHISSLAAVEELSSDEIIDEQSKCNPISNYGLSKRESENYLLSQKLPEDKNLIILRPTMIHGPGEKGNLGLLIKFVNKGIPYPLGAFSNQRSFLGIDNLCFIIEKIFNERLEGGVYMVADDKPLSTVDVIKTISQVNGKKLRILKIPKAIIKMMAKVGDIFNLPFTTSKLTKMTDNLIVSNSKLKNELNLLELPFTATEGLTKTVRSFNN